MTFTQCNGILVRVMHVKASAGPQLKPEDILITRQGNTQKREQMSHHYWTTVTFTQCNGILVRVIAREGQCWAPTDIQITRQGNTYKCEQMSHHISDHCDIHTV